MTPRGGGAAPHLNPTARELFVNFWLNLLSASELDCGLRNRAYGPNVEVSSQNGDLYMQLNVAWLITMYRAFEVAA